MAWNPSPEIAALRDFAGKFGRPIVVVFSINADGLGFTIETYGKTKALCKLAGAFGDQIAEAVKRGDIAPPPVEPFKEFDPATRWVKAGGAGDEGAAFDWNPWVPPFKYDDSFQGIVDANGEMVLDVRGWGFLTGAGAKNINADRAAQIQDRMARFVTGLLNAAVSPRAGAESTAEEH